MADILFQLSNRDPRLARVSWANVTDDDTALAYEIGNIPLGLNGAVQIEGTFDGATVALEGTVDGTNFHTLTTLLGAGASLTSAGIFEFTTAVLAIRPKVTGGGGSESITVTALLRFAS